jgi:O-methyltransferase involved in polyketide biosynthesis
MQAEKISLTGVQQTMLITLYAKALDNRSRRPVLNDRFADAAVRRIDHDFSRLDFGPDGAISLAIRAKAFDDWTRAFVASHPGAVVLNLGCGLDSRVWRVDPPPEVSWFDVDLPGVAELRWRLYPERAKGYWLIGASVVDPAWLDEVPRERPVIVLAEGLMPYLDEEQAPRLLRRLVRHFRAGEIAFDAYSRLGLKMLRATPQLRATGAEVHWALDDAKSLQTVVPGLVLVDEKVQYDAPEVARMSLPTRLAFAFLRHVPAMRKVGRLLRYRWGGSSSP